MIFGFAWRDVGGPFFGPIETEAPVLRQRRQGNDPEPAHHQARAPKTATHFYSL
jgi:hypothetical protein